MSARRTWLPAAVALLLALPFTALLAQDATQRRGFSVTITEPENQALIVGKTKISAKVKIDDPDLLDRVEFIVGDEVIFVDREAPFECFHDFGENSQSWIVRAVAYHVEEVTVSDAVISRKLPFSQIERVNRVILWVTATDKDGNLVTDLTRDDFKIYEDDTEQKVLDFHVEERAIKMAILIDTSGSMVDKIEEVHQAAGAFVENLREIDEALIIDFDENVFLIQDLTSDVDSLREAIQSTEPLGGTSLYDAVHAAYRKIGTFKGRKVIVVLSDGEDTLSQFSFERVLREARTNSTMIYSIGLGIEGGAPRRDVLKDFSSSTGGEFYYIKKKGTLGDAYKRIAEELGKQYYLTYSTTNEEWNGRWVKMKVESLRKDVKIRARRGYFAVRTPGIGG
ncbi:MAG: VWA domain-containing protein [Planctomycetota bacterium]|jgi:Ca-activated chloride channel family protein